MKRVLLVLLATAGLVVCAGLWAWWDYQQFQSTPLDLPVGGQVVQVNAGDSVRSVLQNLAESGAIQPGWHWRLMTRMYPVTIQTGEYLLEPGLVPATLLDKLASGQVIQYFFTMVEGWNYQQLHDALLDATPLLVDDQAIAPDHVMFNLDTDEQHPEGWFLPETYAYVRGDTALDVLKRAYREMRNSLAGQWEARDVGLPLDNPYQMLILASIVEKESAVASERPEIAGVFVRRLQQNWRLETDPTVIYGIGRDFDGDIRRRDLKTDNPYNTYTRRGLPPTPIAMPGPQALEAVAHPATGTSMFFVADGQGGHTFSDTLEAHNRAVQALIQRQRSVAPAPVKPNG